MKKFLVLNDRVKVNNAYLFQKNYHCRYKRFDGSILFDKVLINLF